MFFNCKIQKRITYQTNKFSFTLSSFYFLVTSQKQIDKLYENKDNYK